MENILISVVICTYNRSDKIIKTLDSLIHQKEKAYEIIVVDNNSTDDTKEIILKYIKQHNENIIYCCEKTQGATSARNKGAGTAKGNLLVFFDDDIIAEENYIKNLKSAFLENNLDYVGGSIELNYLIEKPEWLDDRLAGLLAYCNYGEKIIDYPCTGKKFPISANIAIRKEVFNTVGGFSANELDYKWAKPCNDDILFGIKVHEAGFKLTYLPNIKVKHLIPEERLTIDYFKKCYYFYGLADIAHEIIVNTAYNHLFIFFRSLFRMSVGFIKSRIKTSPTERHWQLFRIYYNWGLIVGIVKIQTILWKY